MVLIKILEKFLISQPKMAAGAQECDDWQSGVWLHGSAGENARRWAADDLSSELRRQNEMGADCRCDGSSEPLRSRASCGAYTPIVCHVPRISPRHSQRRHDSAAAPSSSHEQHPPSSAGASSKVKKLDHDLRFKFNLMHVPNFLSHTHTDLACVHTVAHEL
jgi:hypothetical protein